MATLRQTIAIAIGQYQPQVVRMPPARGGVESSCNNIIGVLNIRKRLLRGKRKVLTLPTRDLK